MLDQCWGVVEGTWTRFIVGAPYEWFLLLSLGSFVTNIYAAAREHGSQMNMLAFDLLRASIATNGLWTVATFAVLWNRPLMLGHLGGGDIGPSRLTFFYLVSIGIGWLFFALFRIQASRGRHPFQERTIQETAVRLGAS